MIWMCLCIIADPIRDNFVPSELIYTHTTSLQHNFDSLNVRFIGNWPFGPSWTVCCDTTREIVFLGLGGSVCILDVSDPLNIILLSDSIRTRGFVNNLFYDYTFQRLYISASSGGLEIWSITNPTHPSRVSIYTASKVISDVFIQGEYAYLACGSEGLRIVDISDPSNPHEIGYCLTPDSALSVIVSGIFAYVGDGDTYYNGGGLVVVDISIPTNPQVIGYCNTPSYAEGLALIGNYIYVADGEPGVAKLRIIDVSIPTNPYEVAFFRPDTINWFTVCTDVYVKDTIAFVAYHNAGIFIVNVSNPMVPVEISRYNTSGQAMEICINDSFALVADDEFGLCLLQVGILSNPHEIGHYDAMYCPNNLFAKDTLLFISHGEEGLVRILNISDPMKPKIVGQFSTTYGADGVFSLNSYIYVTDWNGLCIVDISDINNPQMIGFCDLPGYPSNVFIVDTFAYVASYFGGLYVVNIAIPTNPYIIGVCNAPYEANDVIVIGGYAYVANYYGGFYVINIAVPSNPQVVGFCNVRAAQIDIRWPFAYAAGGETGVHIINISNPTNPQKIATFPAYAIDVRNTCTLLYIGDNQFGLRVINVSNPYAPSEVGFYQLPNLFTGCVCPSENFICIGTIAGLQIFEYMETSVEESDGRNKIIDKKAKVMQNPVHSNILQISYPSTTTVLIGVTIFNCLGERVVDFREFRVKNNIIKIPINSLMAGVYFVEIRNNLVSNMFKFIVIR